MRSSWRGSTLSRTLSSRLPEPLRTRALAPMLRMLELSKAKAA